MRSVQPVLTLFAASLVFYALFHVPRHEQNFRGMIIKCLPIVILQVLVARHGLSHKDYYGHKIMAAIYFSCIADAVLDFPGYFLHGAMSFLVAHILYISAFGFTPLKLGTGVAVFGILSLPSMLVLEPLMKLEGIQSIALPIYALVLKTMIWRAVVKSTTASNSDTTLLTWATGFGGVFFGISDAALAIDRFYQPFQHSQKLVMAFYYLSQLCFALSVLQKKQPSTKTK